MKVKQARAVIKAAEQEGSQGRVTALVSVFNNEDSMGDVVRPGAFTNTLIEWSLSGDSIPVLWSHRMDDPNMVVGHVIKATETSEGLEIEAQLDLDSTNGAQVYRLLKGRRIKNWSFAYDVEAGGYGEKDGRPVYELRELKLHEVSPCIIGANQETRTEEVKSSSVDEYRTALQRYKAAARSMMAAGYEDVKESERTTTLAVKAYSGVIAARKQALAEGATEEELEQEMANTDEIAELRTQLEALQAQVAEAKPTEVAPKSRDDSELRKSIADLGSSIAGPGQKFVRDGNGVPMHSGSASKGHHLHPRVKASGGSNWGELAIRKYGELLQKSIVPNGEIFVSVPLDPEPVRLDVPVLTLRQLIPAVPNASGRFAYMRQVTRTNNAAVVARGAKKPTSDYPLTRVDGRTSTIAHISTPVARQDLDDIGMLRQFIDQEMRLGLELALEDEIIDGDGTGEHLTGIGNVSGSQSQAWDTDRLTTARKAVTKLEQAGYLAGAGFLMSAADWEAFELTQDNEARFYFGGPVAAVNASSRRLWGVPVVVSNAATTGVAYLADFHQMKLHIREEGKLDWSENIYDPNALGAGVGASDFERNMIRFRFEGRFGLEIHRPSAIVEVDLTA